jgi:hypothetical protein
MTEVVSLVAKSTVKSDIKDRIIAMLEDTLAEAKAGDIGAIFMIVERPDEMWTERWDGTCKLSELIGRMEIIKHKIIHGYFRGEGEE